MGARVVDHNVHGLVTVRLVDPPPEMVQHLVDVIGPSVGPPRDPDITVSFVDRFPTTPRLRVLNAREVAYDEEHFYVIGDRGLRSRVDIAGLGEATDIVCERGVTQVPLLLGVLGLRLLEQEHVLLHSAAFEFADRCVVVVGWKKGGKTETLLPFLAAGARHLSDEWSIVSPEGVVYGLPGRLQLWSWHLRQLPAFWSRVPARDRRRLRVLRAYQRAHRLLPTSRRSGPMARLLAGLAAEGGNATLGQARAMPEELVGDRVRRTPARIDVVLLAGVSPEPQCRVIPAEPELVAQRMVASLAYERQPLLTAYEQFRFAFPSRSNPLVDSARVREEAILRRALAGRAAYEVVHPYPVRLHDVYEAVRPFVS
jgi:hypothetical protein